MYKLKRRWLAVLCLAAAPIAAGAAVSMDSYGWTIITPSTDSRIVYVSNSGGNDSNNGLSPSTPKKTIRAAETLMRDGYPDHMLLKRGDVFPPEATLQDGALLGRWKNGRSASEPIVVSTYGSGARPVVILPDRLVNWNGRDRSYSAFIGLDLYKANADPDNQTYFNNSDSYREAFRLIGAGDYVLIEDCRLRFTGIVAETYNTDGIAPHVVSNISIRRNIIVDNWSHDSTTTSSHVSGIYLATVHGSYLVEENFFDHCGWNEQLSNADANKFAHNMYIQASNVAGGIIRGNISTRGSSHGLQARSGGVVERNLFAANAIGAAVGGLYPPADSDVYSFDNRFVQNVILNGRLMNPNDTGEPRSPAVWGMTGSFLNDIDVIDNIVANRDDSGVNYAFLADDAPVTLILSNNIVYQWDSNYDSYDPSWPHPEADLGDYNASIGGANSIDAYYAAQRNRGIGEYPWELTAYAAISYFRAGFNKGAVSGYYNYTGSQTVAVTGVSVSPGSLTIEEGLSSQLTATVSPSNATNQGVSWSSSNTNVATVSSSGLVSAVSEGSATITVTTHDGSYTDNTAVTVEEASTGLSNVALGKSVTFSAVQTPNDKLVDGSTGSEDRWSAEGYPQNAVIDLGASYGIEEFHVHPYQDRAYRYTIEASIDGSSYSTVVDRSSNTEEGPVLEDSISPVTARYVRITVTGTDSSSYTGSWVSLRELEVYGYALSSQNVALGKSVSASGSSSPSTPDKLVDGATGTGDTERWSVMNYPQNATIDLGSTHAVETFVVHPYQNRAYQYTISVSTDGTNYSTVVNRSSNTAGGAEITDTVTPVSARYVRINVTGASGYTGSWVSLVELEVFTPGSP